MSEKVKTSDVIIQSIVILVILGIGFGGYYWYVTHKPKAARIPTGELITVVQTQTLEKMDYPTVIDGMGTVIPDTEIELAARVGGEVVHIAPNFISGGRFQKGDVIFKIDPSDYELAIDQRESEVASAEKDLKLEMGQQSVAKRELELLADKVKPEDRELVLRQPHLKLAEEQYESAKSLLKKAQLDLERTVIKSPFNASVQTVNIDVGSQVNAGTPVANLVGTDSFHIEVSVPVDRLEWLNLPEGDRPGSNVKIYNATAWGKDNFRTGQVVKLLPNLETQGRMARLLIEIEDPFCLEKENAGKPKLLLNMYVRVAIEGKEIKNVFRVPADCIHNGNRIYLMSQSDDPEENGRLIMKDVELMWRDDKYVFIRNSMKSGEQVVTSDIPAPIKGMKLQLPGQDVKAGENE